MFVHALTSTTLLAVLALASTLLAHPTTPRSVDPRELVHTCLQWKDIATQDSTMVLRLQHASMALAYLHAARHLVDDTRLEQQTGIDVQRLTRGIETTMAEARKVLSERSGVSP